MNVNPVGDLGAFMRSLSVGNSLKRDLQRLTQELGTGLVADLGAATGGDFSRLAGVERGIALAGTLATGLGQAAMDASARQAALGRVAAEVEGIAPRLLAFASGGSDADLSTILANSQGRLSEAVAALNTRLAGRSLFSGDALDQSALVTGPELLDQLRAEVAGSTDAADMLARIDAFFHDIGGGYDSLAWTGGDGDPPPVLLSEGVTEPAGVTARDPAIRTALSGLALAALLADGAGPPGNDAQRALAAGAAHRLLQGETDLSALQARLGGSEARIDTARVRAETLRSTLEQERAGLVGADPYRTATELEAISQQLDAHYLVTARLARLSLSEYLR